MQNIILILGLVLSFNVFAQTNTPPPEASVPTVKTDKTIEPVNNPDEKKPKEKVKDKIPVFANVGFGFATYDIHNLYQDDLYTENKSEIYGTELNISGGIKNETIRKYQHKVPEKYRSFVSELEEVTISYAYIPDSIYINPYRNHVESYGLTWAYPLALSSGIGFLKFGVSAGPILTYLYHRDDREEKPNHFFRLGLRGKAHFGFNFGKYLKLELGGIQDAYIPSRMYGEKTVWNISGNYAMIHFRYFFDVEAAID